VSGRISQCRIAACLAVLSLQPAGAADWIVRDPSGRRVETLEKSYGDGLVRRDAKGRRLGTVEESHGDRLIIRDRSGRRTGTIERR
jgi:hypothetical protein